MKLGTRTTRKAARTTTHRSISSYVIALLSVIALVALMAIPALAHHNDGHDNGPGSSEDRTETATTTDQDGDADSDSSTAYTEDNDTNDGTANNVADGERYEGDNAHPSGNDRSVENGGSGTQGKSESNPDDSKGPMRYEGALGDDKANGPGGTDLADQDGNNGCGNDDDFDDDNNGHCGRNKPAPASVSVPNVEAIVQPSKVEKVCPANTDFAGQAMDSLKDCNKDIVLGNVITNPATPVVQAAPLAQAAPAGVLGAILPFTGGSITSFLAFGLGLIALGALALKVRSTEA